MAAAEPSSADGAPEATGLVKDEVLLEELGQLVASVPKWRADPLPSQVRREIVRTGEELVAGPQTRSRDLASPVVSSHALRFRVGSFALVRYRLEQLMRHPVVLSDRPILDLDQTIEALARLENHVRTRQPDIIVAMNSEGESISQVIVQDMALAIPIMPIHGVAGQDFEWRHAAKPQSVVSSVCIIGHVAWTGATIQRVIEMARRRFGQDTKMSVAVLAASYQAAELTSGVERFLFHHVTTVPQIRLAIDATHVWREHGAFSFKPLPPKSSPVVPEAAGFMPEARRFVIPEADLARMRDVVRRYNAP